MMKLKLEEVYSHLKPLSMFNIYELDSFYLFLLILISTLLSISNRFVCYFRLMKFTLGKNRLNIVYVSDSI